MLKKAYFFFLLTSLFSCNKSEKFSESLSGSKETFSIEALIQQENVSQKELRIEIKKINNDSLRQEFLFDLSYHYYKELDSLHFRFWNEKALKISRKHSDTSKIAKSYWGMGNFFYRLNHIDSSYFYYNEAQKLYEKIEEDFMSGRMLLNMAIIQKNIKDYIGSEVSTIKAIEKIKPLKKYEQLYMAYNNLGIIHNELGEYEKSLKYHYVALEYLNQSENKINEASSLNNIGVVLKNRKNYSEAVEIFKRALTIDSIYFKAPELYAMLLDNSAHSKLLLNDTLNLEPIFLEALRIRDSIGHLAGIVINKIHLSEFYIKKMDTLKAIKYATEAKTLARSSDNFRDLLQSMLLLSRIDELNSEENLKSYIFINDSLNTREREVRNKFARIRFETDEFITKNKMLNREKKLIIGGSVLGFGVVILIFLNFRQRSRNKQLMQEKDQQMADEKIYNLLLVQQYKLEEGSNREKKRISKELHDLILGNLFSIRLMLESLTDKTDPISINGIKHYVQKLRGIEVVIRNISHDLNSSFLTSKVSFMKLVEELLEERKKVGNFDYLLKVDRNLQWENYPNELKINLYSVLQESINNIIKHSRATNVSVYASPHP